MLDIQHSSMIWRIEAAGLEDNTIIGSSSIFSVGNLIYENVKLLRISQEKYFQEGFKGGLGAIVERWCLKTAENEFVKPAK